MAPIRCLHKGANNKIKIGAKIETRAQHMDKWAIGFPVAVFALVAALLGAGIAPAAARDLTIALPSNVNTLDPDKSTTVGTDLSVVAHIYTPLVDRGPDLKL